MDFSHLDDNNRYWTLIFILIRIDYIDVSDYTDIDTLKEALQVRDDEAVEDLSPMLYNTIILDEPFWDNDFRRSYFTSQPKRLDRRSPRVTPAYEM